VKSWIDKLESRERRILLLGVAALAICLAYLLAWRPFTAHVSGMKKRAAEQRQALQWMRSASQEVKQLQGISRPTTAVTQGQSLLAVVDKTARSARLGPTVTRVEPDGSNGVRVWLEKAAFDDVVLWLDNLLRDYNIEASAITLERQDVPGVISARVTLTDDGG